MQQSNGNPQFAQLVNVKGFVYLTDAQRDLFHRTYSRHLNAWGSEKRHDYLPEQLNRISWDPKEGCLKVYFKNGDWCHYSIDGTWF